MVRGSQRTRFTGTALIRLLARLGEVDVPESKQAFAQRLSQWLGWTHAIALSTALDDRPDARTVRSAAGHGHGASAEEAEFTRVRNALANTIAHDSLGTAGTQEPQLHAPRHESAPMDTAADFSPYRRRYIARQQAMEASIAPLRDRLRAALSKRSPEMARLAAVDAVMAQALAERERHLLSSVPRLLEKHFERLRRAHQAPSAETAEAAAPPDDKAYGEQWLNQFCKDMQSVLLAELDIRLQPAEALLATLRMSAT